MTTTDPRSQALEDLLRDCRELRVDPTQALRVIQRVEEIDRLHVTDKPLARPKPLRKPRPILAPHPNHDTPEPPQQVPVLDLRPDQLVQGAVLAFSSFFLVFVLMGLMVLGAASHR